MNSTDLEILNNTLRLLLPALRDALRQQYGEQLDAWLARGESKAVVLGENEDRYVSLLDDDDIQEHASELFYLDMQGYDGFSPRNLLTAKECEQIREQALSQIEALVRSRAPASGLRSLISEIVSGKWDDRPGDKEAGAFFVYAAIIEDGQSERLADLWILEHSPEFHDYLFLIEDGASLNQSWRVCVDVLPPNLVPLLDLEWVDIAKVAA